MTCPACNRRDCDHVACYLEEPTEDETLCLMCEQPWDENGYCAACDEYRDNLFGTVTQGDPFKRKAA